VGVFFLENKKIAAIYIRVSTDAQREEGYSIDAQKEMLQAHCVSKGLKNYAYYIDGGFTGSNIERPQMQLLISDVKQGKISHVVVYKLDRLSRSQKDTLYLIEDVFNPMGVDFISRNESMDT
jgi:site-specific DNA recombinase